MELLDDLVGAAQEYAATLEKNEAATRAVLVDPVLRALGWDTANTYMVEVERVHADTRVDDALCEKTERSGRS